MEQTAALTSLLHDNSALFAALLQKFRHQRRPARLVARAQACAVIAVKVFVKQNVIPEMRIGLELFGAPEYRPSTRTMPCARSVPALPFARERTG
jgi:hypothetical protein